MKNKIIPVIHVQNINQVLFNIDTIINAGLNKAFIINHISTSEELIRVGNYIHELFPTVEIGFNFLDRANPMDALNMLPEYSKLLWTDNAYIEKNTLPIAKELFIHRDGVEYFGGVAFKYQNKIKEEDFDWFERYNPDSLLKKIQNIPIVYKPINEWSGIKYKPKTQKLIELDSVIEIIK